MYRCTKYQFEDGGFPIKNPSGKNRTDPRIYTSIRRVEAFFEIENGSGCLKPISGSGRKASEAWKVFCFIY